MALLSTAAVCLILVIKCDKSFSVGLDSIYSVIINIKVNIYTMSCETGSDSRHFQLSIAFNGTCFP